MMKTMSMRVVTVAGGDDDDEDDDNDGGGDDDDCRIHTMTVSLHSTSTNSPQFVK